MEENEKITVNIDLTQLAKHLITTEAYNKTILEVQAQILSRLKETDMKETRDEINKIFKNNFNLLKEQYTPSSEKSKDQ